MDLLLDGDELWTHVKVTNPHTAATLGYWWTCAAHMASPSTRILAPASLVTVETYVGAPLRNAPWPDFDNGMLNSTFSGVGAVAGANAGASSGSGRLTDSSYLGNIAYTGDYFLRVPNASRKWIAHVDDEGAYVAVHGHPMPGTKFFTWGQSGPGRFMQDFLAGGAKGTGYYTELQSGLTPTQQQVFTLDGGGHVAFTEYFKPLRRSVAPISSATSTGAHHSASGPLPADYDAATHEVSTWWDSAAGVPQSKVAAMEAFFKGLEDRTPTAAEILSRGSAWGALHQKLSGTKLAPGTIFGAPTPGTPAADESAMWEELADTGTFSATTVSGIRAPLAYAVDALWVAALEASVKAHGETWLHQLLLAVAYAEAGEVEKPRKLLQAAMTDAHGASSPIVVRTLAVLETSAESAWTFFERAWNLTAHGAPPPLESVAVTSRLAQNVADEVLMFIVGHLPGATAGTADVGSVWYRRLEQMSRAAQAAVGERGSDTILLSRIILLTK